MLKVPVSVRLLTPDAAGRPAVASSDSSTAMLATPPGPHPVTAIARRAHALQLFAGIIEDNIHELVPSCRRPALTAETVVGGIYEVVSSRILADRTDELPGLADDILVAVLMLDVNPTELTR